MTLTPIQFNPAEPSYLAPTWDELDQLTLHLAKQVRAQNALPDMVVALAKGAWPMSRSFVDYLGINQLVSLGVKFYCGINQRITKPEIYQALPISVKGKNLILFDDVVDSGGSLIFAKKYLLEEQGALSVRTATLLYKAHAELKPDFYAEQTNAWITFPFEKQETIKLLMTNWRKQGLSLLEMRARFKTLGFGQEVITYYCV